MKFFQRLLTWRFFISFLVAVGLYGTVQYFLRTNAGDPPSLQPLVLMSLLMGLAFGLLIAWKSFDVRSVLMMILTGLLGGGIRYFIDIAAGDPVEWDNLFSSSVTLVWAMSLVFLPARKISNESSSAMAHRLD